MFNFEGNQWGSHIYVRNDAPETSRAAAASWIGKTGRDRLRILSELAIVSDGLTDQELQDRLGIRESSERPRRVSLHQDGLIAKNGQTRPTASKRLACVWTITDAGRQALRQREVA